MENGKKVKEVCQLTGLNGKILHTYDRYGIVKPTGYQNHGYEGRSRKTGVKVNYSGYKLYDDEAIRKLQIAAIYEKLQFKRTEIKNIFKSNKSETEILNEQISMLEEKKKDIENTLNVAKQLRIIGMKGELATYYATFDFAELAKNETLLKKSEGMKILEGLLRRSIDDYINESERILNEMENISNKQINDEESMLFAEKLFDSAKANLGFLGWFAVMTIAFSANGGGIGLHELCSEYEEGAIIDSSKFVVEYMKNDIVVMFDEYVEILLEHSEAIGQDYSTEAVKELVEALKMLLGKHFGLKTEEEYAVFFEFLKVALKVRMDECWKYTLDIMEYYHHI